MVFFYCFVYSGSIRYPFQKKYGALFKVGWEGHVDTPWSVVVLTVIFLVNIKNRYWKYV